MGLVNIPEIENIYKYISKLENKSINIFFRTIFKTSTNSHQKGRRYVIIDATSIPMDINTWRKKNKIGKGKSIPGRFII